jgi:hypothetical protein
MAVAKWRTLSDTEKEEWRVKPRRSGGGGGQKQKFIHSRPVHSRGLTGVGDEDMLSISSVRVFGCDEANVVFAKGCCKHVLTIRLRLGRGTNGT